MNNQKKILIASSYPIFTERIGGMDCFFWELDKQLKNKGYSVSWLFRKEGNDAHYQEKGLDYQIIDNNTDFTKGLLAWVAKNTDANLFIGHFLDYQSTISKTIKNQLQIPCVYVDHMSRSNKGKSFFFNVKRFFKGMLFYNKIDGIIAVSNVVKISILNEIGFFWKSKIQVIYNGLPLENYKIITNQKADNCLQIFCIGHVIKEKGFQVVVESCKKLQENNIPFKLTIAGDGIYKKELENLAQVLPLNSVVFLGNITNQAHYLNQSDVVVIPSLWKEAFGFTLVEAMLMKKVIFASNIGAIPEILNNNKLLFEAGNPNQLAQLLIDYVQHKENYVPLAQQAYERAQNNFSIDKMVSEHLIYLDKFLK